MLVLGGADSQTALAPIDLAEAELKRLVDAQPTILEQPSDGRIAVLGSVKVPEESVDFVGRKYLREGVVVSEQARSPRNDPVPVRTALPTGMGLRTTPVCSGSSARYAYHCRTAAKRRTMVRGLTVRSGRYMRSRSARTNEIASLAAPQTGESRVPAERDPALQVSSIRTHGVSCANRTKVIEESLYPLMGTPLLVRFACRHPPSSASPLPYLHCRTLVLVLQSVPL